MSASLLVFCGSHHGYFYEWIHRGWGGSPIDYIADSIVGFSENEVESGGFVGFEARVMNYSLPKSSTKMVRRFLKLK
jgi:hypothetical protein